MTTSGAPDRVSCRAVNLFLAAVLLLFALAPLALEVAPDGEGLLLPGGTRLPSLCLVRHLTGHPCPTCSLGRSIVLATHGRFGASWRTHRGGLLVLGWILIQLVARLALGARPPRAWRWRLDAGLSASSLILVWMATVALGWTT